MTIDTGIRKPGPYSEITEGTNQGLPTNLQEMLIVAQRTSSGTVAKHVPTKVYSADQAAEYFGPGSVAHRMAIAAFAQYPYVRLTIVALDDSDTGVPATSTVTISGPATAAGTAVLYIGTETVEIAIADEDTATEIAAAFKAAINALTRLPVTADNDAGVLTLTAKNDGTCGNMIGRYDSSSGKWCPEIEIDCAGVSAEVVGFASGANDADLDDAFAAVLPSRFHQIAFPFIDATNVGKFADYLDLVSDSRNQRGARGYIFMTGALADATTIAEENNKRLHLGYIRKILMPSYEAAAAYAAMQNAESNLALPLNNVELVDCDAPAIADRLTDPEEVEACLWAGVTPFIVATGEVVRCVRAITTYTEDDSGNPDTAGKWLDSQKIGVADYVRDAVIARHKSDLANKVIKDVHSDADPDFVVTCEDIESINIDVCKRLEAIGYVDNVDDSIPLFDCTRPEGDLTRVNSKIPIDIVDPLQILATEIMVFSTI